MKTDEGSNRYIIYVRLHLMIDMNVDKKRSIAKTLSWRVIATLTTALVVLSLTGETELALAAATVDTLIKLFLYYLHERGWTKVKWGIEGPMISESA